MVDLKTRLLLGVPEPRIEAPLINIVVYHDGEARGVMSVWADFHDAETEAKRLKRDVMPDRELAIYVARLDQARDDIVDFLML